MTAANWGSIRARLILSGVPDPLRQLSFHALLDVTEHMLMDSCKDEKERMKLQHDLYMPSVMSVRKDAAPPPGFSVDEEMSAFSKLMQSNNG